MDTKKIKAMVDEEMKNHNHLYQAQRVVAERLGVAEGTINALYYKDRSKVMSSKDKDFVIKQLESKVSSLLDARSSTLKEVLEMIEKIKVNKRSYYCHDCCKSLSEDDYPYHNADDAIEITDTSYVEIVELKQKIQQLEKG